MKHDKKQKIGKYGLEVTQMGMGGAALGNLYATVGEATATDTIAAAYGAGIRYFDTAPLYGYGRSETRLGAGLSRYKRNEWVISTKVGYSLVPRTAEEPSDSPFVDVLPCETRFYAQSKKVCDVSRPIVSPSCLSTMRTREQALNPVLVIHTQIVISPR